MSDIVLPRIVRDAMPEHCDKVLTMPAAEYHSDKTAVSQGALQEIEMSPAHFVDQWQVPYVDHEGSDEMRLGTLAHEALLEPELYAARIVKPEFGDQRYKENKDAKATWLKGVPQGAKLISETDKRTVENMCVNALAKKEIRDVLACSQKEATIYWVDESTLILNRARIDILAPSVVWDVKTVGRGMASKENFAKKIANDGYDFQGASYMTAADHVAKQPEFFKEYRFIVMEREAPFACAIYSLNQGTIAIAKARRAVALRKLRDALDLGRFDDYGDEVQAIDVPYWHKTKRIETEAF